MNYEDARRRFKELAGTVAKVKASNSAQEALKGMYLGALYGLCRAMDLRFRDRSVAERCKGYGTQLTAALRHLATGRQALSGQWLAGFYFNDGLFRLAAVYARSLKMATQASGRPNLSCLRALAVAKDLMKPSEFVALGKVQTDVNDLKHNDGLLPLRRASLDVAVSAAGEAADLVHLALTGRRVAVEQ